MKIACIKAHQLAVPLVHPYVLSKEYGVYSTATPVIVEIETDEGIVGYGESDPWPLFTGDSAEVTMTIIEKHLGPMLLGADPTNINEIHRLMDAIIRNQHMTKAAIDMACYDILGKKLGAPVHQLLGGKRRDAMKCMWSAGGNTPEEAAEQILESKKLGYNGCMIKVGTADWKNDVAKTIAVREAVGDDFALIADANQGWDINTAIKYCQAVADCGLLFFEQPLQSWDVEGMAEVRRNINIPLSADEGVATIQDARNLIAAKAVDIFSIKVSKNGGIAPAKEICKYAAANGIKVFFNSMIEEGITEAASLHIGVTTENIVEGIGHAYFSPLRLDGDICDYYKQIHPELGVTEITDKPGLGIELDQKQMAKYTVGSVAIK
mgnify:FL=1